MVDPDAPTGRGAVEPLAANRAEEAVAVLCDAFGDYPVMRHVIFDAGDEYHKRLHTLIAFFVAVRFLRNEPVLAVSEAGKAVAVAILTPPVQRQAPAELAEHQEVVWRELGAAARRRYETLGACWQQFAIAEPHYHLNMIGVRRSHAGRGLSRLLLDAVHEMSRRDSGSTGVSLTTEVESNVALYEHFGYDLVGHATVANAPDTWVFFRRDGGPSEAAGTRRIGK
jgi:GNAT superfamily N-acetyltransferase